MTNRFELPVQLMSFIAKHYPSWIAVATAKEGSQKMAEINFDRLDPVVDPILKDGIAFENDAVGLLPCQDLDPTIPFVWFWPSNLS